MTDIRTTPELDNFGRADENPLSDGGRWAQVSTPGYGPQLQVVSHEAIGQGTSGLTVYSNYWTPAAFSGDVEVWGLCAGFCDLNDSYSLALWTGVGGADSDISGYVVNWSTSFGSSVYLYRQDSGVNTLLDAPGTIPFPVAGDYVLLRTNGTSVETYQSLDGAATWQLKATAVDNTYRTNLSLTPRILSHASSSPGYAGVGGGGSGTLSSRTMLPFLGAGP